MENKKEIFEQPKIEIVVFEEEDIITTSYDDNVGLPWDEFE